jgi:hypothetical protein
MANVPGIGTVHPYNPQTDGPINPADASLVQGEMPNLAGAPAGLTLVGDPSTAHNGVVVIESGQTVAAWTPSGTTHDYP